MLHALMGLVTFQAMECALHISSHGRTKQISPVQTYTSTDLTFVHYMTCSTTQYEYFLVCMDSPFWYSSESEITLVHFTNCYPKWSLSGWHPVANFCPEFLGPHPPQNRYWKTSFHTLCKKNYLKQICDSPNPPCSRYGYCMQVQNKHFI